MFKSEKDTYTLANGAKIPCIGFGTWQSNDGQEAYNAVLFALRAGYRHIDTAAAYGNEASVGRAINDFLKESSVKREELFITSKLWNADHGYEKACAGIQKSLDLLNLDYMDLYLIHWPNPIAFRDCWQEANAGAWKAMEEFFEKGKIKNLGVSNFMPHHLEELAKTQKIAPLVNQVKLCPGETQVKTAPYCKEHNILLEAYSPMGTGKIFENKDMIALSKKYGRSIAQICIRWSLQQGYLPLPKSVTESRIKENLNVFDFELTDLDCALIASLQNTGINPARDPDTTQF